MLGFRARDNTMRYVKALFPDVDVSKVWNTAVANGCSVIVYPTTSIPFKK
jgi:hypothetical protein